MAEPTAVAARCAVADWAASGAMWLTRDAAGVPVAGGAGAAAVLREDLLRLADVTRRRTGSTPELPGVELLGERAATACAEDPGWAARASTRTLRASDGWWMLAMPRPSDLELVPALVQARVADSWAAVVPWSSTRSRVVAVERAQLLGLAAAVVHSPSDHDPLDQQAQHRRSAPVLRSPGGPRSPGRSRPLVVDLSALWAGPLCASLLGLAGAEVVKVESTHRLDGGRQGPAAFYDLLHAGHASVTVDLGSEAGRSQLRDLVAAADVVIESSRPRALAQLGVDARQAVERGTIWTSITAYGRTGPWSHRIGFGDDVAAAAGLVTDVDGVPAPCGDAIADPLAGVCAATATADALLADTAVLLDVSMRDAARTGALHPVDPALVVGSQEQGWQVECCGVSSSVAAPAARQSRTVAARPGADNDTWLGVAAHR